MGFINSKSRIMDTIITLEGRRQIATGKMKAEFYSFTDAGAFYAQDLSTSASLDGTRRPYLEAVSLPQDGITFESDDAGKLVNFRSSTLPVRNGKILTVVTSSTELSGTTGRIYAPAEDSVFSSMANTLLSSSLDSFLNNRIIGSPDPLDENREQFLLNRNTISYRISDSSPFAPGERSESSVETTDGLFVDSKLSHLPNFQYLPPINKYRPGDSTVNLLGNYPILNQRPKLTFADVEREIQAAAQKGYSADISFDETSRGNNLVCQMFELGQNEIVKLDIIDFGLFNIRGEDISESDKIRQEKDPRNRPIRSKRVFFAGKVFTDSAGVHKFINLFTLIFEG
jgi:hypothetical protein